MREVLFLFCVLGMSFLAEGQISTGSTGRRCTTPNKDSGDCINIRQCPKLLEMLRNSRSNPDTVDFLRRSSCGFENSDPKVCCPNTMSDQPARIESSNGRDNTSNVNSGRSMGNNDSRDRNTRGNDPYPKLLAPPKCGVSDNQGTRIVGGTRSTLGAWPWLAALGYRRASGGKINYLCGSTLVTNRHLITAAHCTKHPSLKLYVARLGELDLDPNSKDGANPVDYIIKSALAHPAYDARRHVNDIAVLYLKETVQFTKHIQPICLPKADDHRDKTFESLHLFVAGWGAIKYKGPSSTWLQQVQVPVVSNQQCRSAYLSLGADVTSKEICAGFPSGGKDACSGDSGGPLMWPSGGLYYLIGVVAYGHSCADPNYPGIYTRTTEYLDWINKNLT